jgi:hypothetical protein
LKHDSTCAETRFLLSPKRTSPYKSVGASVKLIAGSRGVRISVSNAGYTTSQGSVRVLATHSIRQFPLHYPSHASLCAIRYQMHSTRLQAGQTVNKEKGCKDSSLMQHHVHLWALTTLLYNGYCGMFLWKLSSQSMKTTFNFRPPTR